MSDICYSEEESLDDHKYFITFLDVYTHFCVVNPIVNKNDALDYFQEFEALATTRFTPKIISFKYDNGAEHLDNNFCLFCRQKNIQILHNVPYCHEINGACEN